MQARSTTTTRSASTTATAATAAPATLGTDEIRYITLGGPAVGPFSPAVRVGNLVFASGQIGTDSTGTLVKGGIEAETAQTLRNLAKALTAAGSSMDRVVKCTVFMADMKEWPAMNTVYTAFFPRNKPARSAFGSTGLARDARVEIECIGVAGTT